MTPSPNPNILNVAEKLIIFREGGRGYPLQENSAKIINSIFEPFPKLHWLQHPQELDLLQQ